MADRSYTDAQAGPIPDAATKKAVKASFGYVLENLRLGAPAHQTRATNLQAYWIQSTTASDTNEFSIAHGLPSIPRYAIPMLELNRPGAQLPPLTITRAADARRIYMKTEAGSTSVPFLMLVE